jgi:hypothetical protein
LGTKPFGAKVPGLKNLLKMMAKLKLLIFPEPPQKKILRNMSGKTDGVKLPTIYLL